MKKMKALVTGGAGFIGSHIAQELVARSYDVIVIDDLSTGKIDNIEELISKAEIEFVLGNVTDLSLLKRISENVDYIFHEAAIASVPRSIDNPLVSHVVNVTGTLNVLMAAAGNHVKKVIYASSCAIYGNNSVVPNREDIAPDPQSPYAVTKLAAEYYCDVFNRVYGLPTICLRYFNVYGSRQDHNSQYAAVIPKFIQRILDGKSPVIYGDGEQSRDFVFVKDIVEANLLAAESEFRGVFNIGTGESYSLNQLADILARIKGSTIRPIYEAPRVGDVRHSVADISKAKMLDFNPKYKLESGLRQILLP